MTVAEGDGGTTTPTAMVFTVTRTGDLTAASSADWTLAHGTTTAGDFTGATNGTVTFAAGAATATITVNVVGDTAVEGNETFTINLSNATGATITDASGAGTITNDDAVVLPTLAINDVSVAEGNGGTTTPTAMVFTVTRTGDLTAASSADWTLAHGTTAAGDFTGATSGTVTFAAGAATATITVNVVGDTAVEGNETFTINLSNAAGATITDASGAGTITNDDAVPGNRAPSGLSLSGSMASEYSAAGTLVGALSAFDADGNSLSYTLTDSAAGRFMLDATGTKLLVADGSRLDFEQAASHNVTVQVSDGKGGVATQTFTVNVADINPESTLGTSGNDVFYGGAANDVLRGNLGNDRLYGGAGTDIVKGEGGNDTIGGGAGRDKLYGLKGGTSRDAFVFDTKLTSKSVAHKNKDIVYDFGPKYDSIYFDDAAFTNKALAKYFKGKNASLDKPLKMKSGYFKVGTKATDKDDFFIYDSKKQKLYWDVDGSGSKAMLEIGTIKLQKGEGTKISYKDFFSISPNTDPKRGSPLPCDAGGGFRLGCDDLSRISFQSPMQLVRSR